MTVGIAVLTVVAVVFTAGYLNYRHEKKEWEEYVRYMNESELRESRLPKHMRWVEREKRRRPTGEELGI